MSRCPIVVPQTVTVSLPDGETLDLKKRLNAGEYRDMLAAQYKEMPYGETRVDLKNIGFCRVLAYVVGWTYDGLDGRPLPITADSVNAIDTDTFADILDLVNQHHEAIEKASAARKNGTDGANGSSAISPSPSSTAGDMSGLTNSMSTS